MQLTETKVLGSDTWSQSKKKILLTTFCKLDRSVAEK
jgi:hypothetical protein